MTPGVSEAALATNGHTMQIANTAAKDASCIIRVLFLLLPRETALTAMSTDAIRNTTGKAMNKKSKTDIIKTSKDYSTLILTGSNGLPSPE